MKKWRIVVGLLINLLTIAVVGYGLSNQLLGYYGNGPTVELLNMVHYFTNLSNALVAVVMFICVIADIAMLAGARPSKFFAGLKLFAIAGTTLTCVVTVGYLAPIELKDWWLVYGLEFCLALHVVAPVLAILSYWIENKKALRWYACFLGLIAPAIYGGYMIPAIHFGLTPVVPYQFLVWDTEQWWISLAWAGGLLIGSVILCLILNLIRNIGNKPEPKVKKVWVAADSLVAKPEEEKPEEEQPCPEEDVCPCAPEEPECPEEVAEEVAEEKPEEAAKEEFEDVPPEAEEEAPEEPEPEPEPEEPKPVKKPAPSVIPSPVPLAPRSAPAKRASAPRAYYITKQASTGKWQVKLGNAERAIRLFDTQAEAIAFAKGIVESKGGSFRIHSVKGGFRKG